MIRSDNLRSAFVQEEVDAYIYELLPKRDAIIAEIETYAEEHRVPIIGPAVARLLTLLVQVSGAKRIFEMGSAIGYSTIWLARAAGPQAEIFYTDGNPENARRAQEYFKKAGVAKRIRVHVGDAMELVKKTPGAKKTGNTSNQDVPNIKGDFDVDFRGTLEQEDKDGKWQTVYVERSLAKVKVDDINKPLSNKLDVEVRMADGTSGKLMAEGKVKAFDRFKYIEERLSADESVELQNFPLAIGLPFIPPGKLERLAGIGNGKISVKMEGVGRGKENGQAFPALLAPQTVRACFCGHNHTNDYTVKADSMDLVYGRSSGYAGYGGETLRKAAKTIFPFGRRRRKSKSSTASC